MTYNMTNCPRIPLPKLLSFIVDNRGKTVPTAEEGYKLIATNCIKNEQLYPVYEKVRFLSDETYRTWFRAHPEPGDIIFVNKGTPGRVCIVPDPVDFCIAQDMIAFRTKQNELYNKFLLAVLRSSEMQTQVYNYSVGDVIPHFKKSFLDQLLIPLPDMLIQKQIGDLYFVLSDKIENNNTINQRLEQMAQAIFKSWFVDFKPTIKFTEAVQVLGGGTPKTSEIKFWNGDIPFFTPKDALSSYVLTTEKTLTRLGLENCSSRLYPINTVFVTARGTVGKLALAGCSMAMNQSCYALIGKKGYSQFYVYHLALDTVSQLIHKASGAVFDAIVTRDFDSEMIPNPPFELIHAFEETVTPVYQTILNNLKENIQLANLRDTLLPKLLSGEIAVPANAKNHQ